MVFDSNDIECMGLIARLAALQLQCPVTVTEIKVPSVLNAISVVSNHSEQQVALLHAGGRQEGSADA